MATSYLSPGVYVEEVDRGTKPLEMVGTSTVGFIGECAVGPVNQPVFCTNWSQYTKNFGDFQNSRSWRTQFTASSTTAAGAASS